MEYPTYKNEQSNSCKIGFRPIDVLSDEINVEEMIYEIIGKLVILDSDLSKIYKYKNGTKAINQAVNRNIERFPKDFYF